MNQYGVEISFLIFSAVTKAYDAQFLMKREHLYEDELLAKRRLL